MISVTFIDGKGMIHLIQRAVDMDDAIEQVNQRASLLRRGEKLTADNVQKTVVLAMPEEGVGSMVDVGFGPGGQPM